MSDADPEATVREGVSNAPMSDGGARLRWSARPR
jgi:hypothetical protein